MTEDENIGPISSTISDDVDITINSAEVQAYQVTKPEIQVLTTAPANPITTDTGKEGYFGGVEYTIAQDPMG